MKTREKGMGLNFETVNVHEFSLGEAQHRDKKNR